MMNRNRQIRWGFRICDEPESPNVGSMFNMYDEPTSPKEEACLRYMMNRNRQVRWWFRIDDEPESPNAVACVT